MVVLWSLTGFDDRGGVGVPDLGKLAVDCQMRAVHLIESHSVERVRKLVGSELTELAACQEICQMTATFFCHD